MMIEEIVRLIRDSKNLIVFTGAGISVESGVPPFRGESGIWNKYDPQLLNIEYFLNNPFESWEVIREIFYDVFSEAKPNLAHQVIAKLEEINIVKAVITQNIDDLHNKAGSREVYEFHGNSQMLKCLGCNNYYRVKDISLEIIPPKCKKCGCLLKPDFIFFGEGIPLEAYEKSFMAAKNADVVLIIGSTGEVMPACYVPFQAKENGAVIIEINPEESNFSKQITDFHLKMDAVEAMTLIWEELKPKCKEQ